MSFIGRQPTEGQYIEIDNISGGFNSSTTAFTLQSGGQNIVIGSKANLIISISGVVQYANAYSITGTSEITFSEAPSNSDSFDGRILGHTRDVGTVSDGVITSSSLSSNFFVQNETTFNNLTISNKNAVLVGDITVNGTLTITGGNLVII